MKALLLAPMGSVHRRFNKVNIEALQELGYEVHLLANFENGEGTEQQNQEYVKECESKGIKTHSLPFQRHEIRNNIKLIKPTKKLIEKEGYDIIHAHTETGGLILRLVGKTKGIKFYTAHGMSFYKGAPLKNQIIYRPIEKWICNGMDKNIAINKEEYETLLNWDKTKASLVHGIGIDIDKFQKITRSRSEIRKELGIPEDASVVLSIGELDDNKNHIVVVNALKNIPGVYYLICGIGPNKEKLQNAGLKERLILAGYRKDISDIIGASDIFAFPSKHEGLPVSLLEAMAGGLPVICSNIRGNNDLIVNSKNGFLLSTNDSDEWTNAIKKMVDILELRRNFIEQSNHIISKYNINNVKKELIQIYG